MTAVPYDHPDVRRLTQVLRAEQLGLYGFADDPDATPEADFDTPVGPAERGQRCRRRPPRTRSAKRIQNTWTVPARSPMTRQTCPVRTSTRATPGSRAAATQSPRAAAAAARSRCCCRRSHRPAAGPEHLAPRRGPPVCARRRPGTERVKQLTQFQP
ncbi:hypothetical protein AB0387_20350 [Streptomyces sp. NPDC089173]|uniref:hypothetical protein n=1 Tax=Streptomyces sp. NPDC089173 TaxID=3154965 RepID=UPI00344F438D